MFYNFFFFLSFCCKKKTTCGITTCVIIKEREREREKKEEGILNLILTKQSHIVNSNFLTKKKKAQPNILTNTKIEKVVLLSVLTRDSCGKLVNKRFNLSPTPPASPFLPHFRVDPSLRLVFPVLPASPFLSPKSYSLFISHEQPPLDHLSSHHVLLYLCLFPTRIKVKI